MRILAGTFKGRLLKAPKSKEIRPTTSLVRKAVFDLSQPFIEHASFLDLFAGSGAMGIEALSRGARTAFFIDKDFHALRALEENLFSLKIDQEAVHVLKGEALVQLKRLAKKERKFDLIYVDPPYDLAPLLLPEILKFLDSSSLLASDALLFVEERAPQKLHFHSLGLKQLHFNESRRSGLTLLHIFRKVGATR